MSPSPELFNSLTHLMQSRCSVRAFTDQPIPLSLIEQIVRCARSAPSGANLQPGRFHVLTGAPLQSLSKQLLLAVQSGRPHVQQYSYFPQPMPSSLKLKQRDAGFALYNAVGISKRDIAARRDQFNQNYRFFDAPVGIVVSIDKAMGKGCYMDLGMAIMSLLLSAQSAGLASTGIGALANHADVVHEELGLPDKELVVCGIALGYADSTAAINQFRTVRDELANFASFRGFS